MPPDLAQGGRPMHAVDGADAPIAAADAAPRPAPPLDADLLLVGGGLANGLLAWRLKALRPELRILLVESEATLGGNHTWSFHDGDLDAAQHAWIKPFVVHRWPRHHVAFPQRERCMDSGYASVTSQRFHTLLSGRLGPDACTRCPVASVTPTSATLADGRTLHAAAVIDGRGVRPSPHLTLGYQKFLGQELRLAAPHGLDGPLLMDARVAQHGGYRFVYLLPFSADTLLVEDTVYADGDSLAPAELRTRIADYVAARGWTVAAVLREEHGVLPITLAGDPQAFWREAGGVPRAGLAAGLFHPTTGYSLPDAVRLADGVAALPDLAAPALFAAIRDHAVAQWQSQRFFRLLNRMLFLAGAPASRWRVMQRFYGLSAPLVTRFYAARLTRWDKIRIVTGKPPVPLIAAVRAALATRPSAHPPARPPDCLP